MKLSAHNRNGRKAALSGRGLISMLKRRICMKKIRIKRWIGMLLALCLVMGFSNFPLTALAAENLAAGETLTELTQDKTMQTNNGTITTNNGTVGINDYDATVETNYGTVTENYGTVTDNFYTVKTNYGTVTENYGTVTDNFYTVKTNSGTVNINHDTVNSNRGTVETNYHNATVETNYGTVTTNASGGTVTDNFYTVKTNSGTVVNNYYNATVEINSGTVTTNAGGGTVTDNYGTVETNSGTVVNNYGGTVGGTSAINNYYKLTYEANNVIVSGLTVKNGNSYILSTASVTLAPPSSQHFKSVVITPEGATLTENDNGTYTLSGVTENIVLTVSTIEHSYSTEWKSDGANHWRECSCGAKTEVAAHNGGTATCKDKAVCSTCGTVYGELAAHNYKDGKCTVCEIADPNYVPETDSPQTGDNSNIAFWIALLLLSGGAIIILTVAHKKRKSVAKR